MSDNDMIDVWRICNSEDKRFTWVKLKPKLTWSRIDYFLVSENLVNNTVECDILPCIHSDHSAIMYKIELTKTKRGPGFWKFNDTLIQNDLYCTEMSAHIEKIKDIYGKGHLSATDLWELIKDECGKYSREFAKRISRDEKLEKFKLYKILSAMQENLIKGGPKVNVNLEKSMESVQCELDSFETMLAKQAAFRSKQNWYKFGEKPSKFFFNMEKSNFTRKTMYIAKRQDGTLTKDYREILDLQYKFYEDLYTHDPRVEFSLSNESGIKLDVVKRLACDEAFSKDELFDAVMTLKAGKCPGADGLSLGFYKKFWKLLINPLYEMLKEAVRNNRLNPSARRGIINLIPKKS